MSKSLSASPTLPDELNCRNHVFPPASRCGSFILQLNLTDPNFPEISIRAVSEQEDRCGFATFDHAEFGPRSKSLDQRKSLSSDAEIRGKSTAYKAALIPAFLERLTTPLLPTPSPSDLCLTERQLDVLTQMMQGKCNKAICRILDLAEPTVKNHVTAILKKLGVTNRTEAVIAVGRLGWTLPSFSASETRSVNRSAAPRLAVVST